MAKWLRLCVGKDERFKSWHVCTWELSTPFCMSMKKGVGHFSLSSSSPSTNLLLASSIIIRRELGGLIWGSIIFWIFLWGELESIFPMSSFWDLGFGYFSLLLLRFSSFFFSLGLAFQVLGVTVDSG